MGQSFVEIVEKIIFKLNIWIGKGYGGSTVSEEVNAISTFLPHNPSCLIDIGANKGEYTNELRKKFGASEIHLFEPSMLNYEILDKRFKNDYRIFINQCGISSEKGKIELFSNEPGSGLASLSKRKLDHFGIQFDYSELVNIETFESYWIDNLNRSEVDLVKIDIEGHELAALQGFGNALEHCGIIQFEFGGCNIDTKTFFQDFWYFFTENGFDIYRISPVGTIKITEYSEKLEFFSTTNYLAINRSMMTITKDS